MIYPHSGMHADKNTTQTKQMQLQIAHENPLNKRDPEKQQRNVIEGFNLVSNGTSRNCLSLSAHSSTSSCSGRSKTLWQEDEDRGEM